MRPGALSVEGVQIDSRRVESGDLFVAVGSGGFSYLDDALERGAAATLLPRDGHEALAQIGRFVRSQLAARVVGITGSVGKTTTKDIVAALCAPHRKTVAAEASYNNELGVPLTLCRADADTEVVVSEMGTRGLGQLGELCEIAKPHVGVITSIGPAHLEHLGSLDDVAQGKAEILSHLPEDGVAVVPAAEARLKPYLASSKARVVTVGAGGDVELVRSESGRHTSEVEVKVEGTSLEVRFNLVGRHNIENAIAAVAVYAALDLPLGEIGAGSENVVVSPLRSAEIELEGGGLLLNDSYNANPMSMEAAIEHLAMRAGSRRRIAVLGTMAELGPAEIDYHRATGALLAQRDIDVLIGIGDLAVHYSDGLRDAGSSAHTELVDTTDEAIASLREHLQPGDCVLVKASRSAGLEVVAEAVESIVA
ncbi:MAG: UDP-N-acetylmuramoyl-tripeptide--D-alanyl-D-alanine ligase [Gaiellaceae bacterium]